MNLELIKNSTNLSINLENVDNNNINNSHQDIIKEQLETPEQNDKKFTFKQKIALSVLAIVDFMSSCSMSIMAPFYPQEAATKGMTESMAGFVFGFYALIVFLSSPFFGKILPKIGIKLLFISGVLLSGVCCMIFGLLNIVNNYNLFAILSFLIRGLEALGASAYSTASYVIIVNIFPDNAGAVRGLLETFVGLGMSVGPALGGFLFTEDWRFRFTILCKWLNNNINCSFKYLLLTKFRKLIFLGPLKTESGSFTKLLKLSHVQITCLILITVSMTWSFLDPTLEPHLRKFKLSPGKIGLLFLLVSTMYGVFSPLWGWIADKIKNYFWLMIIGLFFNFLTLLLLGPSSLLEIILKDSLWLNIISLSILGISVAMALIPTYQSLLDSALDRGFDENLGTHSVIAGLWSCIYSLGEVLGPILGGSLLENFGFSITTTVFSLLNLIVAILSTIYFIFKCRKTVKCIINRKKSHKNCFHKIITLSHIINNNNTTTTTNNNNCNNNNNVNNNSKLTNKCDVG